MEGGGDGRSAHIARQPSDVTYRWCMTSSHPGPEDSAQPFDLQTFIDDFLTGLDPETVDEHRH